jgi:TonB family protein
MIMWRVSMLLMCGLALQPALAGEGVLDARTGVSDAELDRKRAQQSCGTAPSATLDQMRDFTAKHSADYALYGDGTPPVGAKRSEVAFRSQPTVRYPASLRGSGAVGKVMLMVAVSEDGAVADSLVICSNHPDFAASALKGLKSARFSPQKNDGVRVVSVANMPLIFIER